MFFNALFYVEGYNRGNSEKGRIMFNYPISYPFAGLAQTIGARLVIRVNVSKDDDAGVFIAVSPDVKGLVVEAESFEQLQSEVVDLLPILLSAKQQPKRAVADYHLSSGISFA